MAEPVENLFPEGATCENCVYEYEDAIAYCRECKRLLCEECLSFHKRSRDTNQHETVDSPKAEELKRRYRCQTHTDKTTDYFCNTCNTAVCQHCQIEGCNGHEMVVSTTVKQNMSDLLGNVKTKREEFLHHAEFIQARMAQNTDAFNRCESEIIRAFSELARVLEERKKEILQTLREQTESNEKRVQSQKEFVDNTIREMERTIAFTENLLQSKKDAKLMVNKLRASADLEGRASHEWNKQNATYRSWQLEHKDQEDYAARFARLLPHPGPQDILVQGIEEPRVGVTNVFTVRADIKDQFGMYDATTLTNLLSVKISFSSGRGKPSTTVQRTISREDNVWTVSYILRQHGSVTVSIGLCGVSMGDRTYETDPTKMSIKVGDVVTRGPDWKWDNQDGGRGCQGRVVEIRRHGWVSVKWDRGGEHDYRWGSQDSFDLEIVQEPMEQ